MSFNTSAFVGSFCFWWSGIWYCHSMLFNTCLALIIHSVFDEVVFCIITSCHSTLVWLCLFILFMMKLCFVLSLHVIEHLSGLFIHSSCDEVLFCIVISYHSKLVWLYLLVLFWWSCVLYCHSMSFNTCLALFIRSVFDEGVLYCHSISLNSCLGRPWWLIWMRRPTGDQDIAGSTPAEVDIFFVEIDNEIFSTVILSLPLIQEGQLSVSDKRMCTILVNRLEDWACPLNVWLDKLTALDMSLLGWLGRKTSTHTKNFSGFVYSFCFWWSCVFFLLGSGKGCGLWLWHSLDFSLTFFFVLSLHVIQHLSGFVYSFCFFMKRCFVLSLHVIQHLSGFVYSFCFLWRGVLYCHSMSFNTLLAWLCLSVLFSV